MTRPPVPIPVLVLVSVLACRQSQPQPPPPLPPAPAPASSAAPATPAPSSPPDGLVEEQRDPDPRSETVTIKVGADPRRQARVLWGRKDLGVAPLVIARPRDSGPLDLLVLAPGCLPLHVRAFTDRDDRISLRLYGESEAPTIFGYRGSAQP